MTHTEIPHSRIDHKVSTLYTFSDRKAFTRTFARHYFPEKYYHIDFFFDLDLYLANRVPYIAYAEIDKHNERIKSEIDECGMR